MRISAYKHFDVDYNFLFCFKYSSYKIVDMSVN